MPVGAVGVEGTIRSPGRTGGGFPLRRLLSRGPVRSVHRSWKWTTWGNARLIRSGLMVKLRWLLVWVTGGLTHGDYLYINFFILFTRSLFY